MTRRDNYLAPRYLISVGGTKLREDVTQFVSSVSYEEGEDVAAKIEIDVANRDFRFLDAKTFAEGNAVDLWMGYVGRPLRFMGRGIVVKPNPSFPRAGVPRIRVIAHDVSRKLMDAGRNDKGRHYAKKRDSEVAEAVFREIEVAPFTVTTKGLKSRTRKKGTTRWEFLKRLARLNGFVVNVRFDVRKGLWLGFFGPPDFEEQESAYKFSYGTGAADATLLEFTPDYSTPSQGTKVEAVYTDPKTKRTHRVSVEVTKKDAERTKFEGAAGAEKLRRSVRNGPSVKLTVFGQSEEVVPDRAFRSVADAKRWVAAWWFRRQREFVFGRGTLLGEASLRKGQVHELKGLGARLSGKWQFTSVAHRQAGGAVYETAFTATKVALQTVVSAPGNVAKVRDRSTAL